MKFSLLLKGILLGKKRGRREEKSIILCCSGTNIVQIHKMCMQSIYFDTSMIQMDYTCISVCANKLTLRRTKLHPKAAFSSEVIIQTYCHFCSFYNGRKSHTVSVEFSEKCRFKKVTLIFSTIFFLVGPLGAMQMFSLATVLKLLCNQKCL